MRCYKCDREIEEGSVFCPECGTKQEVEFRAEPEKKSFCSHCGTKAEAQEQYCGSCGKPMQESASGNLREEKATLYHTPNQGVKRKMSGAAVVAIFLAVPVVLILISVFGFSFYKNKMGIEVKHNIPQDIVVEETLAPETEAIVFAEPDSEKNTPDTEVDISKVDIDAVHEIESTLEGEFQRNSQGEKSLVWEKGISIYGYGELGEKILKSNVTTAYIEDAAFAIEIPDTIENGRDIIVKGYIRFQEDAVYIQATGVTDKEGNELEKPEEAGLNSAYIIVDSNSRYLGESDVFGFDLKEVNYAKNEVYARHGRKFDSRELQDYFNSKSWYIGTIEAKDFKITMLSKVERHNIEYLDDVEHELNPKGYQLDAR